MPTPDQQVAQSETLEQIANRIATDEVLLSRRRQDLYFEILSALRNERERCAKVPTPKLRITYCVMLNFYRAMLA